MYFVESTPVVPSPFKRLYGTAFFGAYCEGPPGHAHGGSQFTVLDEISGALVRVFALCTKKHTGADWAGGGFFLAGLCKRPTGSGR